MAVCSNLFASIFDPPGLKKEYKMSNTLRVSGIAATLIGMSLPLTVAAQTNSSLPKAEVALGIFITENNSNVRLDSDTLGIGTEIDLEDDLGFDSSASGFRVDGLVRLGDQRRHQVNASYFKLSRNSNKVIDRDIQVGDTLYSVNTEIDSGLDIAVYKVGYSYALSRSDVHEVGANLGVFVSDIGVNIGDRTLGTTEARSVTVPLPTVGLTGRYSISPKIQLSARGDVFFISTDSFGGNLYDFNVGVDYWVTDSVALSLGYNYVDIDGDIKRDAGDLGAGLEFKGAVVSARYGF